MSEVSDEVPGATRRSISSNTAYSLAAQSISAAFTIALTLFLVRALPPHGYGVLGLVIAVGGLVLLPAEFGVAGATGRFISQHYDDVAVVADIVRASMRLKLMLTGSTCVLLALLAPVFAEAWGEPDLVWPLRVVAVVVFAQSSMSLLANILNALGRVDLNLWIFLTESVLETGLALVIVTAGAGALGALVARAVGFGTATSVGILFLARVIHQEPLWRRGRNRAWTKMLLGYGGALLIVDSAFALFSQIDIILIGAFLSASAVGVFAAALKFAVFLMLPAVAITAGVAYRVGRPADRDVEKHSLMRAARHVLIFQGFTIAPLVVWATPIADVLFGRGRYPEAANVLRALAPFVFLSGFGNLFSLAANFLGQARKRVPIALLTVVVNCGMDIILIPRIGVVAGAIGTDVAYALYAPAHVWICASVLGVSLKPLIRPAAWTTVAAGSMCGTLALLGTGHLGIARIAAGAIAATTLYLAVILLSGTLTQDERRKLLLQLSRRSRRTGEGPPRRRSL